MEAIWRRLHDVNLELPEELVVLMTLMGRPSILRDPKKNSGISKRPFSLFAGFSVLLCEVGYCVLPISVRLAIAEDEGNEW